MMKPRDDHLSELGISLRSDTRPKDEAKGDRI
jgi:hypothetical protein